MIDDDHFLTSFFIDLLFFLSLDKEIILFSVTVLKYLF